MHTMRPLLQKMTLYALLAAMTVVSITPFLWIVATAFKSPGESIFTFPPRFIPAEPTFANFAAVFTTIPLLRYVRNSIVVVAATVTLQVLLAASAAFPLARMRFPGKTALFAAILATLMIPVQLTMIPNFIFIVDVGLKNTLWGVILPNAVTAFGIFLLRQAMVTVPRSMEEAALIDGSGSLRVLLHILLPTVKPAIAALAIFTFVNAWGDFLWPLLVLDDPDLLTVPLGVQRLQGTFTNDWRLIAAGTVLAMIPVIAFFLANQRHFIEGAIAGGVKG